MKINFKLNAEWEKDCTFILIPTIVLGFIKNKGLALKWQFGIYLSWGFGSVDFYIIKEKNKHMKFSAN